MTALTFHWFLPTNGGDRRDVGGGHGVDPTAARRRPTVPHLEEAYWFGEGVLPELAQAVVRA